MAVVRQVDRALLAACVIAAGKDHSVNTIAQEAWMLYDTIEAEAARRADIANALDPEAREAELNRLAIREYYAKENAS